MPEQNIPDGVINAARSMAPRAARCEPLAFQQAIEMAYLKGCLDQQRIDRVQPNYAAQLLGVRHDR